MMNTKTTEDEELDYFGFTEEEKRLVRLSRVSLDSQINRSRTISEIYFARRLEESVNRMVASNEKLAASNDRFSRAANWLTVGLLVLAFLQLIMLIIQIVVPLIASN